MRKFTLVFIILIGILTGNAQVLSEWRGIGRTGIYQNESNLLKSWAQEGPELLWYAENLPKGYASVAVAHNNVFVTGIVDSMDVLLAFDNQGNKLWQTAYGRAWESSYEHSRCTPTIDGEYIFVSSGLGDMACINANDGSIVWKLKASENFNGSPGKFGYSESLLVVNDLVLFTPGGDTTTMVALKKSTGEIVWKSPTLNDNASYTSPCLINTEKGEQVLNLTENYLFSVNPKNGSINWTFDFGQYAGGRSKRNNQTNTPLFYNNEIFITSGYDHKSVMLSLVNGGTEVTVKWVDSVLDVHHGGVIQIDGYLYGANWLHNRMGNWTCIKWDTGEEMYSEEWGNKGAIVSADDMLYCYDEKSGTVGIAPVNPNKFEIKGSVKLPYGEGPYWAHPVINQGKLYVRNATALMVYNIKQK